MRTFHFVDTGTLTWMDSTLDRQSPRHLPMDPGMSGSFICKSPGGNYVYTMRREVRRWQDGEPYWYWEIRCEDQVSSIPENVLARGTEMHCRAKIAEEIATRTRQVLSPEPKPKPIAQQPANYGDW